LRNLVERAILLSPEDVISLSDIRAVYEMKEGHEEEDRPVSPDKPLKAIMEEQERRVLQSYWGQYGNTSAIARLLKVSQPTVSRKLKKYNIGQWVPQHRED
jgi:TyrR family helix-turn-helix protein